ncbi:SET-domain containing protein lysinemethyltransferase family protein [Striga asiatica]|uniref:SET-domain containing protein lysinemethyltransferase family protein n=1 Tax=Striga asiatica TaxID=4170 RepID=A0A5A7PZ26_STRAF|nr:SET-domain containing protein lysinemethyltransferase family protein [Striga asiatica]
MSLEHGGVGAVPSAVGVVGLGAKAIELGWEVPDMDPPPSAITWWHGSGRGLGMCGGERERSYLENNKRVVGNMVSNVNVVGTKHVSNYLPHHVAAKCGLQSS